jgi:hypothetical protein
MTRFATALFLALLVLPAAAAEPAANQGGGASAPTGQAAPADLPASRSCYDGPAKTEGVGVCRAGVAFLFDRSYGPCIGQVLPGPESCNGLDDDCNGKPDDGLGTIACGTGACAATAPACVNGKPGVCTPGPPHTEVCDGVDNDCNGAVDESCSCVHVAPTGNDADPGTADRPMRTINVAIQRAGEEKQPKRVCVAAGSTSQATFDYAEAVVMRNGVSVYGGYVATGAAWPRGGGVTRVVAQDARGVYFNDSIVQPTILDGFTVSASSDPTNAAITVEGSTGAVINNDVIAGGGGTESYGIKVGFKERPATPHITNSAISGGTGADLAVGVDSVSSAPVIQGNCSTFDAAGRCTADGCRTSERFIRGHVSGTPGKTSHAVRLESSPGALVAQNALCGAASTGASFGLWLAGNAAGTIVRANHLLARGSFVVVGIWVQGCDGAAPWILDNDYIAATGIGPRGRGTGVLAFGDCHPRINANRRIVGSEGGGEGPAVGINCGRDSTGHSSRCSVVGNEEILGSFGRSVKSATGIRCDLAGCAVIAGNTHVSGFFGQRVTGLALIAAGPFVDANVIDAGCGMWLGIGVLADNAFARVQNNLIRGNSCPASYPSGQPLTFGARIYVQASSNDLDLHSNVLQAGGARERCTGHGLSFEGSGGKTPLGLVRNNIIDPGECDTSFAIEQAGPARPRVVEHNDLWSAKAPTALLVDQGRSLTTIEELNALPDGMAHDNISADPLLDAKGIAAGSPCRNAGTARGAPATDFARRRRPAERAPDIGPYEYVP